MGLTYLSQGTEVGMEGLMLNTLTFYLLAAAIEIAECFAFWSVPRLHKPWWWLIPGLLLLVIFVWCLTKVDCSLRRMRLYLWREHYHVAVVMWLVENTRPNR